MGKSFSLAIVMYAQKGLMYVSTVYMMVIIKIKIFAFDILIRAFGKVFENYHGIGYQNHLDGAILMSILAKCFNLCVSVHKNYHDKTCETSQHLIFGKLYKNYHQIHTYFFFYFNVYVNVCRFPPSLSIVLS